MLRKVWSSHVISRRTKLRIFNTNMTEIFLYGSESWRTTKRMTQFFINKCLKRILKISRITNEMLWERAREEPIEIQILRREWRWIGHTLRKAANSITRHTLQGNRKRGRPRSSRRRCEEVGPHLEHARKACTGQKPLEI